MSMVVPDVSPGAINRAIEPGDDAQERVLVASDANPAGERSAKVLGEQMKRPSVALLEGEIGAHRNRLRQENGKIIHRKSLRRGFLGDMRARFQPDEHFGYKDSSTTYAFFSSGVRQPNPGNGHRLLQNFLSAKALWTTHSRIIR